MTDFVNYIIESEAKHFNSFSSEDISERVLEVRRREGHAMRMMGIELIDCGPGWATGEIQIGPQHINPIGSVHGGIIFALADSVGGTAACTRGNLVTTSTGSINFLNAAMKPEKLAAKAVELKVGKNILTYDVYIYDSSNRLIAKACMEYYNMHIPI